MFRDTPAWRQSVTRSGAESAHWRGGTTLSSGGYLMVKMPDHHRARRNGYVLLHVLRAERALGRPLPATAVVHHPDDDRANPNARLVICNDPGFHAFLHALRRVRDAGGRPFLDRICSCCGPQPIANFTPGERYCRECRRELRRGI